MDLKSKMFVEIMSRILSEQLYKIAEYKIEENNNDVRGQNYFR